MSNIYLFAEVNLIKNSSRYNENFSFINQNFIFINKFFDKLSEIELLNC